MENLRPNKQRTKNAIIMISVVGGLEVISLISGYFQYDLLQTVYNGGDISTEVADANDLREQIIGITYFIAYIASIIVFIQWFRRAYYNLHQQVNNLSFTEGWAAGCWFVPIISLYRPYQIMKELYKETIALLSQKGSYFKGNVAIGFLGLWWAFWLLNNILGQVVFRYSKNAETLDQYMNSTILGMVANFVGIPLAIITVKVIMDYSKIESMLWVDDSEEATLNALQA